MAILQLRPTSLEMPDTPPIHQSVRTRTTTTNHKHRNPEGGAAEKPKKMQKWKRKKKKKNSNSRRGEEKQKTQSYAITRIGRLLSGLVPDSNNVMAMSEMRSVQKAEGCSNPLCVAGRSLKPLNEFIRLATC